MGIVGWVGLVGEVGNVGGVGNVGEVGNVGGVGGVGVMGIMHFYFLKRSLMPSMSKARVKRSVWSRGFDCAVEMT